MRIYILYFITSLLVAWVILVLLGVSAGFANKFPVIALIGCLLLFSIATPLTVYNKGLGMKIGLVALVMILPYAIGFTKSVFDDGVFNWGVVLGLLPILLVSVSIYLTVKDLFFNTGISLPVFKTTVKIVLAAIPIILTILYFAFYGKAWLQ